MDLLLFIVCQWGSDIFSVRKNKDYEGQVSDSCSFAVNETLLHTPHEYFVRVKKDGDTNVHLDKIPFSKLFNSAANN